MDHPSARAGIEKFLASSISLFSIKHAPAGRLLLPVSLERIHGAGLAAMLDRVGLAPNRSSRHLDPELNSI